ncbi:CD3324 family protein [Clostridium intestinale]|uniref:Mor transcription activator domain-containing protein n=1 Tax=Clostridium intestinale URNW TaxID=1294142 RepID=U2NI89_9CLOT|nr:CD3324 family protein [Clostridium intestinale]ERK28561.1 Mor transcription activator domain-containing protein [Clostridium intestinale URNW]
MSYANAKDIFPDEILELIQKYVDGKYIYIPRKEENKIAWGELSQSKKELSDRNTNIYEDYLSGESIQNISNKYYLSFKTIQRIILQKKNMG